MFFETKSITTISTNSTSFDVQVSSNTCLNTMEVIKKLFDGMSDCVERNLYRDRAVEIVARVLHCSTYNAECFVADCMGETK